MSYEYTSSVASKLFNFASNFLNSNVSDYLSDPQTFQCKESKFSCQPHGHVITGDIRVVGNAKLRELVAKETKYIEPNRVNWKATETIFLNQLISIQKLGSRENRLLSNISLNGKTN